MVAMASSCGAFQLRSETASRSAKTDESGATTRCSSMETAPTLASRFRTLRTVFLKRWLVAAQNSSQVPAVFRYGERSAGRGCQR